MAFGLSTPIVNRTRSLLARRSPASTILELLDAAVACSRAANRPLNAAVFDDYVIRIGDGENVQWVLAPWNVPVEIAAELAFSCARDCLAFIQNLDFRNESTLPDAEKHLRGVLNAASLLHSLVFTVPSAAYVRRLFGHDVSRAAIAQSLTGQSLYVFLFRLAQRERVASHGEKLEWTDEQVIRALLKLTAAALVDKSRRDGLLSAFEFIDTITEVYMNTTLSAAIDVLHQQQYRIAPFLQLGVRELGQWARETYLTGDTTEAYRIFEFGSALRDAFDQAGIDILDDGRANLHALLSMSTGDQAPELCRYVEAAAALAEANRAGIAEDLVAEFLSLFGDREAWCAQDPAFWRRAVERSEAMKFQNVTATMAFLRRAAAVQPESALARAAKALCSEVSPNGEPAIVLLSFLQQLRDAVAERMNSRYHPTQCPSTAEQRWKEQSVLVLRELYDALPGFLRRRAFQERLFQIANLNSDVIDPQWNVVFYEAHETIKAYMAQQRATGKRGREEVTEQRYKRGRKEPEKEIER